MSCDLSRYAALQAIWEIVNKLSDAKPEDKLDAINSIVEFQLVDHA